MTLIRAKRGARREATRSINLISAARRALACSVLAVILAFAVCPIAVAWAQEAGEEGAPPPPAPEEKPSAMKTLIAYSLSIAGTFVVIALVIYTLSRTLKYEPARNALIHLLRTAPNHAEQQCATMPHSFYEAIGSALKTAGMCGGVRDPKIIASATTPAYDAIGGMVIQHWKGLVGKAKLAALATIGGIAIKPAPIPIIFALVAIGGLLWLMFYKAEIDRSIFRAKVEVMPEVDRAFVEGRYYIAPRA